MTTNSSPKNGDAPAIARPATIAGTVYLNGAFVSRDCALISPLDRGYLFADSVYEVIAFHGDRMLHMQEHLARLRRSLEALAFPPVPALDGMPGTLRDLIRRNRAACGKSYVQISRGAELRREFAPPDKGGDPTVFAFVEEADIVGAAAMRDGISVVSLPDLRWARRDIKSNALLAQCLTYREVHERGADDAFMVEDDLVTEAISANAWIVTADGTLQTRHLSSQILAGVTREFLLSRVDGEVRVREEPFSPEQVATAPEAFISSASRLVVPVVSIDGRAIGEGSPGPVTRDVQRGYLRSTGLPQPDWIRVR